MFEPRIYEIFERSESTRAWPACRVWDIIYLLVDVFNFAQTQEAGCAELQLDHTQDLVGFCRQEPKSRCPGVQGEGSEFQILM